MIDKFFDVKHCDRCGGDLMARTTSWFTDETICMSCKSIENDIRKELPSNGKYYEGCGYIPKVIEC